MTALELVKSYSYEVDMASFLVCIILMIIIRKILYFSDSKQLEYVKRSLFFVLIASFSNIVFWHLCVIMPENKEMIYIFRNIYQTALGICLYTFFKYVKELVGFNKENRKLVDYFILLVYAVLILLNIFSQATGFGFHYRNGLWYDSTFIKPFTALYAYTLFMLGHLLFSFGGRVIKAVRDVLVISFFFVLAILVYQSLFDSNTFTCFTYLIEIIIVLIMLHSGTFNEATGAREEESLDNYIKHSYQSGNSLDYMALALDMRSIKNLPAEVGTIMHNFWNDYFQDAVFVALRNNAFVLAIARNDVNGDTDEKMRRLFYEVFPKHYDNFNINYRVLGISNSNTIADANELKNVIDYFFDRMDINEIYMLSDKDKEEIRILSVVIQELEDIEKKQDLEDERVKVFCQPVYNVATGRYDTAEALMRLELFGREMIRPDIFIPLAERYGQIHSLTSIILYKTCRQIRQMMVEGYDFERVSINVSMSEIRDKYFCEDLINIINLVGIPAEKIGIEITESQTDSDYEYVRERIAILKKHGMHIYLDDFGTGYSNFERILKLGLDVIKFDRSMLTFSEFDSNMSFTLKHFAQAFKEMKYGILFEGVETEEQQSLCLSCGADYLQGFKFSKPIAIEELTEFFEK